MAGLPETVDAVTVCFEESTNMAIRPHILFVDDDSDIRDLVQLMLQTAGFHVLTTDRPADVLRLAATERFDLLLLDLWMPNLTGVDLCRQIRTFDQATPILICSGAVSEADKKQAILAGAQGYVRKPFHSKDLIQTLRRYLELS